MLFKRSDQIRSDQIQSAQPFSLVCKFDVLVKGRIHGQIKWGRGNGWTKVDVNEILLNRYESFINLLNDEME